MICDENMPNSPFVTFRRFYKSVRSETGSALILVLVILTTLTILCSLILKAATLHTRAMIQSEQSLKASEAGYISGTTDFLNLLDSERMILQIKTGLYKTMSDFRKALARLERIVGQDLAEMAKVESMNYRSLGFMTGTTDFLYGLDYKPKGQSEPVEGGLK